MEHQKPQSGTAGKNSTSNEVLVVVSIVLVLVALLGCLIFAFMKYGLPMLTSEGEETLTATETQEKPGQPDKEETATAQIATKSTTPALSPLTKHIDLNEDIGLVPEFMTAKLSGLDIRHLKLEVSEAKKDIALTIPVGTLGVPESPADIPTFAVFEPRMLNLSPSGKTNTFYLKVICLDSKHFKTAVISRAFTFAPPKKNSFLTMFLEHTASAGSPWNIVQIGAWALSSNITLDQLSRCSLNKPDPSSPGDILTIRVATFQDIKTVEEIFYKRNFNPRNFRLFADVEAELRQLIQKLDTNKIDEAQLTALLKSKELAFFKGSTEIEYALLSVINYHKKKTLRLKAFEALLETGLSGDNSRLISRASSDSSAYTRFLAAMTLLERGDPRSLPLLALYAEDPVLKKYCAGLLKAAIKELSGKEKTPDETMLAYWTRVIGWDKLAAETGKDVKYLMTRVDKLVPRSDPRMLKALEDIKATDQTKALYACRELRSFNRDVSAYNALCEAVLKHKDTQVRAQALYALSNFRDFNAYEVCAAVLKQDDDELSRKALDLAVQVQFDNYENLYIANTRHKSIKIRRQVAQSAGQHKITKAEDALLKMSKLDTDKYVKETALRALSQMKSEKAYKHLILMLRSGDRNNKTLAFNCLTYWQDDKKVLEQLKYYKKDPDIGRSVTSHLKRYGK